MKIKTNANDNLQTKKKKLKNKKGFNLKYNDIMQGEDKQESMEITTLKNTEPDNQNVKASLTSKNKTEVNLKNKKHKKKRMLYTPKKYHENSGEEDDKGRSSNEDESRKINMSKTKRKKLDTTNEEYKPGMLSDSIQMGIYDRVLLPWDPSFGMDKSYSVPVHDNQDVPRLKINPLFDLSKRVNIASQPVGEKTQRTIFVGNLPGDTQVSDIKKLFKKCGLIHKIKIKDRNVKSLKKGNQDNNSHKNAFITFKEEESCEKALKFNGHIYKNCHLRVNKTQDTVKPETSRSVFVGNLLFKTEDEDLWKAFESCGEIDDVRIIKDQATGKGKGYGYVNFKTEEAVEKAVKLDGMSILDRNVRVRRNEFGAIETTETLVKRKRGKKKKKSVMPDNSDEESNSEMEKVEIEPIQKKVKKEKTKQTLRKSKT